MADSELTNSWSDYGEKVKDKIENTTYFSVDAAKVVTNIKDDAVNSFKKGKEDVEYTWDNATDAVDSAMASVMSLTTIFNGDQYKNLKDDLNNSITNVLQRYFDDFLSYFIDTETITLGSLMKDIAPYASAILSGDDSSLATNLQNNVDNVMKKLGIFDFVNSPSWNSFIDVLVNYSLKFGTDVMNDGSVQESLQQLSIIQSYANILNSVGSAIKSVQKIVNYIKPILPVAKATYQITMCYKSYGTSMAEWTQEQIEECQRYQMQIASVAMYYVKKYLFCIEINVPKIFVSDFNILSVKKASKSFNLSTNSGALLSMFFDDSFYETAKADSKTWGDFFDNAISKSNEYYSKLSNFDFGSPDSFWQKYGKSLTTTFMGNAVNVARSDVYKNSQGLTNFMLHGSKFGAKNKDGDQVTVDATDKLDYNYYEKDSDGNEIIAGTITNEDINENTSYLDRVYMYLNMEFMFSGSSRIYKNNR